MGILIMGAGQASASLIGDTVEGSLTFSGGATNYFEAGNGGSGASAVVADPGGPEFSFFGGTITESLDVGAESLTFTQFGTDGGGTLNSWDVWVTDLDWLNPGPGQIVDVIYGSNYGNSVVVQFTADSVHISYAGGDVIERGQEYLVGVELVTSHGVIPEPATMTLMGLGLAGLALRRRKSA